MWRNIQHGLGVRVNCRQNQTHSLINCTYLAKQEAAAKVNYGITSVINFSSKFSVVTH